MRAALVVAALLVGKLFLHPQKCFIEDDFVVTLAQFR
jgi:hypothetical protein